MSAKLYLIVSGLVFLLVSILHLVRLLYELPVQAGSHIVPYWLSVVGFLGSLGLSIWAAWILYSGKTHGSSLDLPAPAGEPKAK